MSDRNDFYARYLDGSADRAPHVGLDNMGADQGASAHDLTGAASGHAYAEPHMMRDRSQPPVGRSGRHGSDRGAALHGAEGVHLNSETAALHDGPANVSTPDASGVATPFGVRGQRPGHHDSDGHQPSPVGPPGHEDPQPIDHIAAQQPARGRSAHDDELDADGSFLGSLQRPGGEQHGVSVGLMRAQIRESQVAPPYKPVPQTGWRKGLYRLTRINVGLSQDERDLNQLRRRLKVNLRGKYVIAVMGSKGGVNKTTATICIGAALKQYRDDKIVALDANPASGNLEKRVDEPVTLSWRGLINDRHLRDSSDFQAYLGRDSASGLNVLGSDPGDQVLTGTALLEAWRRLQIQYPIAILDCGNQIRDDITRVILQEFPVNAIVVPSTTRLDGAKGAAETLNWLLTHGYPHLVREAVVVVSNINKVPASRQVQRLHEDFERTVRAVHDVPFDDHLSDAVAIEWARLRPATRRAYLEAAASLVDGFASAADRESGAAYWPAGGSQ
ncbi:MinD/ParA family protein [Mycobacterium sp. TY815]|uniref:MinD/ParA family ATP-binding protein n=1 Tax=Mycobacterium sp. TY815 TaxID=3050581 RepID=UPI0027427632|nr:MinD/ParA family protein [Mycobacterium sp. TY815]MDP7707376.1 MinD/ParA family protein [Mycobacterium sp. TY815]